MLLKKIRLENIRSYVSEEITFPKGSLLLCGDIGSGKSTILLACEFALFGIMKGDISGSDLLRHGAKEGIVELTLDVNGKEVIIKRTLKRNSQGISQDAGYIIANGKKTDLVAKELKARIIDMLGYSQSMVSKSKSLIYRYTVYTPQEDMKKIILSSPQERLDTLRSVFGIDKYKVIRENTSLYVRDLKRKISFAQGQVQGIDAQKNQLAEKENHEKEISSQIKIIEPKCLQAKEETRKASQKLLENEKKVDALRQEKSSLKIIESKLDSLRRSLDFSEKKIAINSEDVKKLDFELSSQKRINEAKLEEKISSIKKEMILIRTKISDLSKKTGQSEFLKSEGQKTKSKITSLKTCPTCLQEVDEKHKHLISQESDRKISDAEADIKGILEEKAALDKRLASVESELERYTRIRQDCMIQKIKIKNLEDKNKEISELKESALQIKNEILELNKEKESLEKNMRSAGDIEKKYLEERSLLLKLQSAERDLDIKFVRLKEQEKSAQEMIISIKSEISRKEDIKRKIKEMEAIASWLEDYFQNLVLTMEKHVMAGIYHEFNDLVTKWFSSLIGDETLSLRLDSEFTPTLEQNGYETSIQNLSGGEKTAVALAYRLSLNKVINSMINTISTKDIIILDEPTDGFSTEQLDRVKEVIDELSLSQVIIVSHEPKIEGFVDSIIRIEKNGHESKVVYG